MPAKVYPFPSPGDLQLVRFAVQAFLQNRSGISRQVTLYSIRRVLDRYSVNRLQFPDYTVEAVRGGFSRIYARNFIEGNHCPNCREPVYPAHSGVCILSIKESARRHTVTYGCRCGTVFGKQEPVRI